MRYAWLLPAGLSAVGALAVLFALRRRLTLGATIRRGPRTGTIEVDDDLIADRAEEAISRFKVCGDNDERLIPVPQKLTHLKVPDAATGELRNVILKIKLQEARAYVPGDASFITDGKHHEIALNLNPKYCAEPEIWKKNIRRILSHEIAHASDPDVFKRLGPRYGDLKTREDLKKYYNEKAEIAAHLVEVQKELSKLPPSMWKKGSPSTIIRLSDRYNEIEPFLTEKTRRRFLRLAARTKDNWDDLRAKLRAG